MYSGEITFENIKAFINEKFPAMKDWTISFEDEEGDSIMITSDIDLEVMREMFPNKEFVKVNIESESKAEEATEIHKE